MNEGKTGADRMESFQYRCVATLEKLNTLTGEAVVVEREGNILLTAGVNELMKLLIGDPATAFSAANAAIAVGDGSAAAAAAQTDLQGANKLRKGMEAGYPQVNANQVTFRAKYDNAEANFNWSEYGVTNALVGGAMLNRKVESLGLKTSSDQWTLTITITIS